ncbi:MAG: hypothetical protein HY070_00180, partial [Chloroflexi bacterium]|nr:hypothetical protein [Chloroflexota bacterium]
TPAPKNAILISNDRDEIMPLWYLQFVEQRRRDVIGLFPLITPAPGYENVGRLIDRLLDSARPVYLIKPMPGIETKFWLEDDHNLIRVIGRTRETPPQVEKEISYTNQLRVKGFDAIRQENLLRVAVFWQARAELNVNYISFVQLFDARGNKIAQGNDHQVGGEYYPTRLWMLDEVLRDEHALIIPDHLAPGAYRIGVGMYTRDRELLGEPVEIGTVTLR